MKQHVSQNSSAKKGMKILILDWLKIQIIQINPKYIYTKFRVHLKHD